MLSKRSLIALLVAVNLLLLAGLVLSTYRLPAAYAQAAPLGQNYVMVAAQIRRGVDGLYILDLANRRMHIFVPNRDQVNRRLLYVGNRDVRREFRGP
jgi:hypothetical protein